MPELSVAFAHLRQREWEHRADRNWQLAAEDAAVAALLEAIDGNGTVADLHLRGVRILAAALAVAAVVVPEEAPRALTVMESHLATECPDRVNCWAADVHDKYNPRPAVVVPTTEEKP